MGHFIDAQLIFKDGILNTTQLPLITSRDFDGISIFVVNRERNIIQKFRKVKISRYFRHTFKIKIGFFIVVQLISEN